MRAHSSLFVVSLLVSAAAQQPYRPDVKTASDEGVKAMAKFALAKGLEVDLFAAEPMVANPVAFCVDERGSVYVCETFRLHAGVTDNRRQEHRQGWVDDDLAARTVDDRVAAYRRQLGAEFDDYLIEHERIRRLVDEDGDGRADRAEVFADGFNEVADGIGAGVLVDRGVAWYTCIPKLWRLADRDGDGRAEERTPLHDGFGVHTALLGHDMHGLCFGPDGKLYFSIGDRGFSVETKEGKTLRFPDTGAVLRCHRDGSELEVFASGLRNPQELAFDDYGNLFTGENNSDGGDAARWVYVMEGGDSGWRMGYQYLPDRGPWNRERLWEPPFAGQAAWIVPPIANLGNGPSGLTYYAGGAAVPERYADHFFLCDFRGGSSRSGIHALAMESSGAGFELVSRSDLIWHVLATDVDFGPDGALYVTDWTEGWDKTGKGRIYRLWAPERRQAPIVQQTRRLLAAGFAGHSLTELCALLRHADRRVRQGAQFALAAHADGPATAAALAAVAASPDHRLARIHAIWALGQLAPREAGVSQPVQALLADGDAEIRGQAARVLGDAGVAEAGPALQKCLSDRSSRVRALAAIALGKLRRPDAVAALANVLRGNADRDPFLRHAAVMGLLGCASREATLELATDAAPAVRLGALLVLRRRGDAAVARALDDDDPRLVAAAARAIHDVPISASAPALANVLTRDALPDRPTLHRAIAAAEHLGGHERAEWLAALAARGDVEANLRAQALGALASWAQPSSRDRVLGLWRPTEPRSPQPAIDALRPTVGPLLLDRDDAVRGAAVDAILAHRLSACGDGLAALVEDPAAGDEVRARALAALAQLGHPELEPLVQRAVGDDAGAMRRQAFRIVTELEPEQAVRAAGTLLASEAPADQRLALAMLGDLQEPAAEATLLAWVGRLRDGNVPAEIQLDVVEAAEAHDSAALAEGLAEYRAAKPGDDPIGPFVEIVAGGRREAGRKLFWEHLSAQCVRCHRLGGEGGDAGPPLDGVGARLDRRQLVEALVRPSSSLTPGYGSVVVTMRDGAVHAGLLRSEDATALRLQPTMGPEILLPKDQVAERSDAVSAMPPMHGPLDRRQLRDLVEFLAAQQ
ncbi:MAG: PVC-type heme-binding CxxCH protein [Planctomycetota bacterium]